MSTAHQFLDVKEDDAALMLPHLINHVVENLFVGELRMRNSRPEGLDVRPDRAAEQDDAGDENREVVERPVIFRHHADEEHGENHDDTDETHVGQKTLELSGHDETPFSVIKRPVGRRLMKETNTLFHWLADLNAGKNA